MTRQEQFVADVLPYAIQAAADTGLPIEVVLAQAALESNWGKAAPGNNVFGVKGKGQSVQTHEFINGKMVPVTDSFRAYSTPKGSFEDYAKVINGKSWFEPARTAGTIPGAISALGRSGYATDPNYANKLTSIANRVESMLSAYGAQDFPAPPPVPRSKPDLAPSIAAAPTTPVERSDLPPLSDFGSLPFALDLDFPQDLPDPFNTAGTNPQVEILSNVSVNGNAPSLDSYSPFNGFGLDTQGIPDPIDNTSIPSRFAGGPVPQSTPSIQDQFLSLPDFASIGNPFAVSGSVPGGMSPGGAPPSPVSAPSGAGAIDSSFFSMLDAMDLERSGQISTNGRQSSIPTVQAPPLPQAKPQQAPVVMSPPVPRSRPAAPPSSLPTQPRSGTLSGALKGGLMGLGIAGPLGALGGAALGGFVGNKGGLGGLFGGNPGSNSYAPDLINSSYHAANFDPQSGGSQSGYTTGFNPDTNSNWTHSDYGYSFDQNDPYSTPTWDDGSLFGGGWF